MTLSIYDSEQLSGGEKLVGVVVWRVEESKIVEHRDTVSANPAEMTDKNGEF